MTYEEVKDFVVINFDESFKSTREKFYSHLCEEKNLRKIAEFFYIFLTTPDELKKYVEFIEKHQKKNYYARKFL